MIRPVKWKDGRVVMIDQTLLPGQLVEITIETPEQMWEAIKSLRVRGAPAIGIAAAFGAAQAAFAYEGESSEGCAGRVREVCDYLATSRPTAVNLFWALDRMKSCLDDCGGADVEQIRQWLLTEAGNILEEDIEMCRQLSFYGADLLKDGDVVLTHCNAGALATGGFGTALGVFYAAAEQGKHIHVYVDETRPLLQGSRLTAWELLENNIEATLICDNMAASVMRDKGVNAVIVGADRIAANGDFANKIGTYGVAVLAQAHGIPFYTAAPWSTIDMSLSSGKEIPIEERNEDEVRRPGGQKLCAPENVSVFNPAFDVTPANFLSGIITERGVARAPFEQSLAGMRKSMKE